MCSSVEFLEEVHILSPRPRHYFNYNSHIPLDILIAQHSVLSLFLPVLTRLVR